jgi:polyisoprenoid-binding protein YceI
VQAMAEQMTELRALLEDGTLAGEWVLDPRKSSVRLKSKAMGLIPVNGIFSEVSGHGTISPGGAVSGTLAVATASIDTKITKRDTHLRSAEIFDSGNNPHITFTVDGIRPSGNDVAVTGSLTVRGRTRPLSLDAVASVPGDEEIWLDATTRINRADFGLVWKSDGPVSKISTLTIQAVFARR